MELVMETNNDFERYQNAKKQVEKIKGFYTHLAVYIVVIAGLIFLNLKYTPGYLWFLWTAVSWGIGLLFHAALIYNVFSFMGKDWEAKKIKQFMDEENKRNKFE